MKDNKLTDKEIIEALEGWMMCLFAASEHFNLQMNREENLLQSAIDLIKRQQETIETLRGCIERHHIIRKDGKSPLSLLTAEIRAEAIKEFAERLRKLMVTDTRYILISEFKLNILVKEMAGEQE